MAFGIWRLAEIVGKSESLSKPSLSASLSNHFQSERPAAAWTASIPTQVVFESMREK